MTDTLNHDPGLIRQSVAEPDDAEVQHRIKRCHNLDYLRRQQQQSQFDQQLREHFNQVEPPAALRAHLIQATVGETAHKRATPHWGPAFAAGFFLAVLGAVTVWQLRSHAPSDPFAIALQHQLQHSAESILAQPPEPLGLTQAFANLGIQLTQDSKLAPYSTKNCVVDTDMRTVHSIIAPNNSTEGAVDVMFLPHPPMTTGFFPVAHAGQTLSRPFADGTLLISGPSRARIEEVAQALQASEPTRISPAP